jgi:hypothetical protein
MLGQDLNSERKHGVAMLTCLAGALAIVMVFSHTTLGRKRHLSPLIMRNWMFMKDVADMPGR